MTTTDVQCPGCKSKIGEAVNVEGLVLLRVGALLVRDTQAICLQCGRMFYWSVSNKIIAAIIKTAMLKL